MTAIALQMNSSRNPWPAMLIGMGAIVTIAGIGIQTLNMQIDFADRPAPQPDPVRIVTPKPSDIPSPKDVAARSIMCLAQDVYYEARGEPERGQIAAAYVVMNRAQMAMGGDVCATIWQRHQFSWTGNMRRPAITEMDAWTRAYQVATNVYRLRVPDPTSGADHYLNKAKLHRIPHWARGGHNVIQIANHTFMKLAGGHG